MTQDQFSEIIHDQIPFYYFDLVITLSDFIIFNFNEYINEINLKIDFSLNLCESKKIIR
jgi:hypothetical protein